MWEKVAKGFVRYSRDGAEFLRIARDPMEAGHVFPMIAGSPRDVRSSEVCSGSSRCGVSSCSGFRGIRASLFFHGYWGSSSLQRRDNVAKGCVRYSRDVAKVLRPTGGLPEAGGGGLF